MDEHQSYQLPEWGPLVLSYARPPLRGALEALLLLDENMARILRSVSGPALGQLRMAWWRDEIGRERASGSPAPPDPLLQLVIRHWNDERSSLIGLVDGWEHLLFEQPWDTHSVDGFTQGRADAFAALARLCGEEANARQAAQHGAAWAQAELGMMGHPRPGAEVALPPLTRNLRSIAIVGGLSRRSIRRAGAALFGDRLSPLAAMRLGIFGT